MNESSFSICWDEQIKPSCSLAGIPLHMKVEEFEKGLEKYLVSSEKSWYQFENAPLLCLEKYLDDNGNGGYGFNLVDLNLTNWELYFDKPDHIGVRGTALTVLLRDFRIYAIKVWQFEFLEDDSRPIHSYQGRLPEGIGLGDYVKDLLPYTALEFDSAEEWFYTDPSYGEVEITGLGADIDLNDEPDQKISAICITI